MNKDVKIPKITIYTPESSIQHPVRMLHEMFRDLYAGRELAWRLAVRDIRAQYRQAALGLIWAFISPLANSIVWIFLSLSGIVALHTTSLSYPLYVITGTILWSIFIDSVNAPMQQVNAAKPMLAKINFPREALILSGIYQTLFNGSIKISILLIIFMLLGIYPGWTGLGVHTGWALIWFPFGILSLILAGTAIGLLVTPVGMLYTDIGRALQLMMQFLMYLTPVVLPMADIFKLNPITPLILTTRDWLTGFTPEYLSYFLIINSISIALLLAVWIIYRVAMPILIERMSS